jgi:hypothetical protein
MTDQMLTRIEKLERQNRRMKISISVLFLVLVALLAMAQAFSGKTKNGMERLEVREIVLSDGETSAQLTPDALIFSDTSGIEAVNSTITASGISLGNRYVTEIKPTGMTCIREGVPRFDLNIGEIGAALAFQNGDGGMGTMLDETTMVLKSSDGIISIRPEHIFVQRGEADAFLKSSSLTSRGADQRKAVLGQAGPPVSRKVNSQAGSVASLVLLGSDDSVVWQAP